ncbi:unnamed protein product [Phyllotreta striolata]|uniref:Uncharacterized protein n=1 Tax=Phyllotreta striolata TaxID=444603 RepID=A0A9N9TR49_PHYSR|nr:unnamed protein product [Phyllotreta striolata]
MNFVCVSLFVEFLNFKVGCDVKSTRKIIFATQTMCVLCIFYTCNGLLTKQIREQ